MGASGGEGVAEATDTMGILIQNLVDAGCSEETVHRCAALAEAGQKREMIELLREHRRFLLENIHCGEKCIDCLDFLIYQVEKGTV